MPDRTLHILNKPPEHYRHHLCLEAIGPEDGLVFIENGVLAVVQLPTSAPDRWYALAPDLEARGLIGQIGEDRVISFDDMVELTATAGKVISW
ncbi:sulfurtransferase complex subunit TusB [Marinobacter confluentis]|nr:sulfurtransferase complex subunit TusB [Marinobacter confluentis]